MALSLDHLDDADRAAILEVLQGDLHEEVNSVDFNEKQREGTNADMEVAFNLFSEELRGATSFEADKRMANSIQKAAQEDASTIIQSQNEERVAENDHNLSTSLSNGCAPLPSLPQLPVEDDEFLDRLAYMYITGVPENDGDDQPETSAGDTSGQRQKTQQRRACAACTDQKLPAQLYQSPCSHEYCQQCLEQLFKDATTDESLFPPRCCNQPMPLDETRIYLDGKVVDEFRKKAIEFSTPNRTYCHNVNCAAFIPPTDSSESYATATCDRCGSRTCTTCKGTSHGGDCPNDEQIQQVLELAREQGWQRCQNCLVMVELSFGCNHMTCRCGYQFCYECGAQWKNCTCPQWDENRLLARGAQIEARDQEDENEDETEDEDEDEDDDEDEDEDEDQRALNQERRIQQIVAHLRHNHLCQHRFWISRNGPRECEECHDVMPVFIYECRQCHIIACRNCRHHRL
ncbi:hypothetical protein F5Y16DRAFT_413784 [Xylariaceae sp. FL0255]|nr:hypothetical protein F5Y16DRAFT_413784 [Xylariaceae sp. FL0255]